MRQFVLLLLVVASLSYSATKSYDVVPYKNCIAVETLGTRGVSQYYRNTLDSLSVVSVWIGDTFAGQSYKVEVKDSATDQLVAYSNERHAAQCWAWLGFPMLRYTSPVRGRTYKVVVSRPSGGAVSC